VNANICMVSSFGCHALRDEAVARSLKGFEFFGYALGSLYGFGEHKPGRTDLWREFEDVWANREAEVTSAMASSLTGARGGIGTPDDLRRHLRKFEDSGVDQVTFIQQAGMNRHEHICEALELFARDVLPEFKEREEARVRRKDEELAPFIEAALARKPPLRHLADDEIPTFPALGRQITEEDRSAPSIYERPPGG
jgi:hypothetical protein